ncbi:MAG: kynureninase [Pyrinomonadaceae bacterium]|nr:kynureninase [Pyrinomonadaceae bacterium]
MDKSSASFESTRSFAEKMDSRDRLFHFRDKFFIPAHQGGGEVLYFTGNSLGLQPRKTREYIEQELKDWETLGVEGHFHAKNPWMPYHEFLTHSMAKIVGAKPIETVVMNSLTVNLHLLMVSFYRPTPTRYKIIIEGDAFPSDQYAVKSQIKFHQRKISTQSGSDAQETLTRNSVKNQNATATASDWLVELTPREGETILRTEDILKTIDNHDDSVALIMLGGVNYYTGQAFDMKRITEAGQKVGAVVGFDLAHAAGNLELKLHEWNVDFACWCSYKYLNSGPGGIAGIFVHERHADNPKLPRFTGWWGHDKETRFLMDDEFVPIKGAEGWQLSNPPIFQMASLRASLEIFEEAGMKALREKSKKLTGYMEFLLNEIADERISIITPSNPDERGCQLSIRVENSDKSLFDAITKKGVVADWREPDVIRVAPVPLYNSFMDVYRFVEILKDCLR